MISYNNTNDYRISLKDFLYNKINTFLDIFYKTEYNILYVPLILFDNKEYAE